MEKKLSYLIVDTVAFQGRIALTTDLLEFRVVSMRLVIFLVNYLSSNLCVYVGTERLVSLPYVQSRLVDGSARNGRLEVYYEGEWGSVCPTNWRYSNALVVCRQLGYFR